MKLASKIFIIIGMVVGFWYIAPIVVGVLALNKLENATSKNELTGTAICTLLLCNTIAGIIMLCMSDEDLQKDKVQATKTETTQQFVPKAQTQSGQSKIDEVSQNIEKLKALKEQGILSEEEFQKLRKREVEKILEG